MSSSSPYPEPPKAPKVQRLKLFWRVLLISNFALGAYIFASARKKNKAIAASQVETKTPESVPVVEVEPSTPSESEPVVEVKPSTPPESEPVVKVEPSTSVVSEPVVEVEPSATPPKDIVVSPPIIKPLMESDLIPTFQQQQLFKWILEEKRKTKSMNEEEKQQIDEDIALLEPLVEVEPSTPPSKDIVLSPPFTKPVIEGELIPTFQQRQLFKWILEEKRKIKPRNEEQKQRIGEDMALLEHYIHLDLIPKM